MTDETPHPTRDPETVALGVLVRSLRTVRGWTQERMAQRCDLAADTVRRIEQGRMSPSMLTLRKLAQGLGMERSVMLSLLEEGGRTPDRLSELLYTASMLSDTQQGLVLDLARVLLTRRDQR